MCDDSHHACPVAHAVSLTSDQKYQPCRIAQVVRLGRLQFNAMRVIRIALIQVGASYMLPVINRVGEFRKHGLPQEIYRGMVELFSIK